MTDQISIYGKILELATRLEKRILSEFPGAWIHKLDDNWTIAINGHHVKKITEPENCMLCDIPPYNVAVWFNGFIAGLFDLHGGTIASGAQANEEALLAAVIKAIDEIIT